MEKGSRLRRRKDRDEAKGVRRTGFARALDLSTGRFKATKDEPDYEYQD